MAQRQNSWPRTMRMRQLPYIDAFATAGWHCCPGRTAWAYDEVEEARNRATPDKARACERFIVHLHRTELMSNATEQRRGWLDDATIGIRFQAKQKNPFRIRLELISPIASDDIGSSHCPKRKAPDDMAIIKGLTSIQKQGGASGEHNASHSAWFPTAPRIDPAEREELAPRSTGYDLRDWKATSNRKIYCWFAGSLP